MNYRTRRRRPASWIGVLALVMVMAACGTDDDNETDPAATEDPDDGDQESADDDEEGLVLGGSEIASAQVWEDAQAEGGLTAYLSFPEALSEGIVEAFSEDTGLDVELVRLPTPQLYERILSESGSDLLESDVISLSEPGLLNDLIDEGVVESHQPPSFDELPEEQRDDEGNWFGMVNIVAVIAYNNQVIDEAEAPASWEELLDEQWAGDIGFNHIGSGGFSWSIFLYLRENFGEDYWSDLADLSPLLTDGVGALTEQLVRGEIPITINHLGTVKGAIADGGPLTIVYPEEGVPTGMEMVAKSGEGASPNAGEVFVNWATSAHGGSIIADVTGEYASHPEADPPSEPDGSASPTSEEIGAWTPPRDIYLSDRDEGVSTWNEIFGYAGD